MSSVKPFGIKEVKIATMDAGTIVTLDPAQKLTFKEMLVMGEMYGNDSLAALLAIAIGAEWALEAGGIPLSAWAIMTGRTLTTSGTTPNTVDTYNMDAGRAYPYFQIFGKVLGDSGDDVHIKIYKAKLTSPIEGEFAHGAFWVTSCAGKAVTVAGKGVADVVVNETATDLPDPAA